MAGKKFVKIKTPSRNKKRSVVVLILLLLFQIAFSLDVPPLEGTPLNDLADMLSESERQELADYLFELDSNSDVQIAVLTIPSLHSDSLEDYAVRVFEKWQLGDAKKDTGVLLLISRDDRKIRIEVGYGLEGQLTDAKSGIIIRNIIAPAFKSGEYGEGIIEAVRNIANVVLTDDLLIDTDTTEQSDFPVFPFLIIIPFFIFFFIMLFSSINKSKKSGSSKNRFKNSGFSNIPKTTYGNSFSHTSSTYSRPRSFSGGGGSSGGGGASGSW